MNIVFAIVVIIGCAGGSQFYLDVENRLKSEGHELGSWRRLLANAAMLLSAAGMVGGLVAIVVSFRILPIS